MKPLLPLLATALLGGLLSAAPRIVEDYERLSPGAADPNFPGLRSNYPGAVMQVITETPGAEVFGPGNTRVLRLQSLTGINPDPAGGASQYYGGTTGFVPFNGGAAAVVSAGFDFMIGSIHSELLFGIGEQQQSRYDDQHYAVQLRIRGVLGLSNKPEIVASGASRDANADIQEGVPYRLELVANKSGAPVAYASPLGVMTVADQRYDVFLYNHRTGLLQLVMDDAEWKIRDDPGPPAVVAKSMQGVWWGVFRYDSTGRALDIHLDNVAVYQDEIVLTGWEAAPPGPVTALADYNDRAPVAEANDPLWFIPGSVVPDTGGLFGAANANYFHVNRRTLADGISSKLRFNGVVTLVSFGFDVLVERRDAITTFSDGHDECFICITGGDTAANANLTFRMNIRGTRSVGNSGNPAEAQPSLNVVGIDGGKFVTEGFDWRTPYRVEVVLNQTGSPVVYNTPWADAVSLPDETVHVYLYNYQTRQNVAAMTDRKTPYMIENGFLTGRANTQNVAGTMADLFWKSVTGRIIDLKIDNVAAFEGAAVVTDPGAVPAAPRILQTWLRAGEPTTWQPAPRSTYSISFESQTGLTYGISESRDLGGFAPLRTIVPADSTGSTTTIDIPLDGAQRFFFLEPLAR